MLPKIDKPLFELLIPSVQKKVKFRPFLVREEKILLIAQESKQEKDIVMAIKQVIQNCCQDAAIDVDKLATFDLEYLFIQLRSRSVNNEIEVSYKDLEDDKVYKFTVDLDKVEMVVPKNITNKISIDEEVGIVMQYPSVDILDTIPETSSATDLVEYMIRSCIQSVYDKENVYPAKDYTTEELSEFIDNLDIETFNKIRDFFDNIPSMSYTIKYKNSLGTDREIVLSTLSDFFTWG